MRRGKKKRYGSFFFSLIFKHLLAMMQSVSNLDYHCMHAILCKLFKNPLEQHTLTVAVVLLIRNPFSHVITVGIWDFMK